MTVYGPPAAVDRGAVVAFAVEGLHPHDVAPAARRRRHRRPGRPSLRDAADAPARRRRHLARELLGVQLAGRGRRCSWRQSPGCVRRSRRAEVSTSGPRDAFVSPRFGQVATFMLLPTAASARGPRRRAARHSLRRRNVVPHGRRLRSAGRARAVLADPPVESRPRRCTPSSGCASPIAATWTWCRSRSSGRWPPSSARIGEVDGRGRDARVRGRRSLRDARDPARGLAPPRPARHRALRRPPRHLGRVLRLEVLPRNAVPPRRGGGAHRSHAA